MRTIVISGNHSNVGKTALAEKMLDSLHNWSALKITTVRDKSVCPRNADCTACSEMKGDFNIITDKKIINQKGTDTARMKKAGAKNVVWLKSNLKGLKQGFKGAFDKLKNSEGVIIEGTSILRYIKPDLAIYLKDNTLPSKAGTEYARKRADIIIDVSK